MQTKIQPEMELFEEHYAPAPYSCLERLSMSKGFQDLHPRILVQCLASEDHLSEKGRTACSGAASVLECVDSSMITQTVMRRLSSVYRPALQK